MLSVSTSPRLTLEFANCNREDRQAWVINGIGSEQAAAEACGDNASMLKVVDTQTGKKDIIAYTSIESSRTANPLPEGVNLTLGRTFISAMDEMESDFRPKGNCFVLEQLATASSHQRRGIGAQLVKYGLEKADRQGMVCYLSGAPMGVLVYRSKFATTPVPSMHRGDG
ncbi:uncharacterized protein RSE6_12721 [Rhynchosporium secalis]|uniref:N-acetyltransferase domain-containing protein n=1 Tax=Rhynchosporium secalis TaxID=38038 RepID=A0A1E1MR76_RHYSE|nr:uncharacterized protein RSE6_12721 [Rhynchosporium secalis]